jgi:hypothetical protein
MCQLDFNEESMKLHVYMMKDDVGTSISLMLPGRYV